MAVQGAYLAWQLRRGMRPLIYAYGQWVDEHVIPLVNDFEKRADAAQQAAFDNLSESVNPETADVEDLYEAAFDEGLSLYQTLSSLYQATINLFAVGLFHLLEQKLAELTHDGAIELQIEESRIADVAKYYANHMGINLEQIPSWPLIDELQQVANVTKHGEGRAADKLRKINPSLFEYPPLRKEGKASQDAACRVRSPLGGGNLYITVANFKSYECAVNEVFDFLAEYFLQHGDEYFPRG